MLIPMCVREFFTCYMSPNKKDLLLKAAVQVVPVIVIGVSAFTMMKGICICPRKGGFLLYCII